MYARRWWSRDGRMSDSTCARVFTDAVMTSAPMLRPRMVPAARPWSTPPPPHGYAGSRIHGVMLKRHAARIISEASAQSIAVIIMSMHT